MAEDIASLVIRVDSRHVETATSSLSRFSRSGVATERANKSLGGSFAALAVAVGGVGLAAAGLKKLTDVTRETQIFGATLETATGSLEGSRIAFEALNDFAKETPYTLDQSIEGFVKLTNLGLNPSEEAMRSYGDTSAALGKSMMDMVEAVADATTGEFERLKEFGIKASVDGDRVSLRFKGVTTEIGNNAAAIEDYLIKLGQDNFGGGMAKRMDTLDGKIANLSMAWDGLFRTIGSGDAGGLIEDSVTAATDAIQSLNDLLQSGELAASVDANLSRFAYVTDAVDTAFSEISGIIEKNLGVGAADDLKGGVVDILSRSFNEFPENVHAAIQLATVEVANFVSKAAAYGDDIANSLKFWSDSNSSLDSELKNIDSAYTDSVASILAQRDAALSEFDKKSQTITAISAITDAATGSFDAIAGMGVRIKEQGDLLEVRFGGVTKTIANDAESIKSYLLNAFTVKTPDFGGVTGSLAQAAAMAEAIGSAAGGSFDALNEFGVKSKTVGSDVEFTFQGVTTTVLNSSDSIKKYLTEIGQTDLGLNNLDQMVRSFDKIEKAAKKAAGPADRTAQFQFKAPDSAPTIDRKEAAKSLKEYQKLITKAHASEIEAENAHYAKLSGVVDTAFSNKVISIASYNADTERLTADHRVKLQEIQFNAQYGMSRDDLAQRVTEIRSGLDAEAAAVSSHYVELQQIADDARSADVISISEYQQTKAQLAADFRAEKLDLQVQNEFGVTADQALAGVEQIRAKNATELEILNESLTEKSMLIEAAFVSEQITAQERNTLLEGIESDHQKAMHNITMQGWQSRANIATGILGNIQQAMAGGSKREFEIGKKAAIATAAIKGGEAAVSSFAAGAKVGGPILGGAFAAASLLATTKQISNIQKQSFGGGVSSSGGGGAVSVGSSSGGGGGFSGAGLSQSQQPQQTQQKQPTTIQFIGDFHGVSPETMQNLTDHLVEQLDNGAILFGPGTEQAAALSA